MDAGYRHEANTTARLLRRATARMREDFMALLQPSRTRPMRRAKD
jgi:hypothetical protein